MSENDWNVVLPDDHTKIGAVPQKIKDVKSSAKIIIAKEHVTPATDNAGGQHLQGSARVYLQSDLPALDPEGNNLDIAATTDNGRLSVNTADGNELRVFVAVSTGISTSWSHVRVGIVKASENIDANSHNITNIASGTQTGQAIHVGQVDTRASTGQLKVIEPATGAKIAVSVLDPPTEDGHVGSKKYIDAQINATVGAGAFDPLTMAGASDSNGTITLSNGLIMKWGKVASIAAGANYTVTFATPFPAACFSAQVSLYKTSATGTWVPSVHTITAASIKIRNMSGVEAISARWFAIGR